MKEENEFPSYSIVSNVISIWIYYSLDLDIKKKNQLSKR